jgi:hypothetical protein
MGRGEGDLRALPDPHPDVDRRTEVRVARDGFVRVGDIDYSVLPGLVGRRLQVRVSPTEMMVYLEGREVVARHRRSFVPADVVLAPAHARALRLAREAGSRLERGNRRGPGRRPGPVRRPGRGGGRSASSEVAYLARALKAPRVAALASTLAEQARSEGWDYEHYLVQVLGEEVASREAHGGAARVKAARFPQVKTPGRLRLLLPSLGEAGPDRSDDL